MRMINLKQPLSTAIIFMASTLFSAQAAELIMLEQDHCHWCEQWHAQIGPIYPKTAAGKRAPLRRVDIHQPMPEDIAQIKSSRFTPTFVLLDNGVEIDRIRGYPGEDFFWGLLEEMIDKLPADDAATPPSEG